MVTRRRDTLGCRDRIAEVPGVLVLRDCTSGAPSPLRLRAGACDPTYKFDTVVSVAFASICVLQTEPDDCGRHPSTAPIKELRENAAQFAALTASGLHGTQRSTWHDQGSTSAPHSRHISPLVTTRAYNRLQPGFAVSAIRPMRRPWNEPAIVLHGAANDVNSSSAAPTLSRAPGTIKVQSIPASVRFSPTAPIWMG